MTLTINELRADFDLAGMNAFPDAKDPARFNAKCPVCPSGQVVGVANDDGAAALACSAGCDQQAIGDALALLREKAGTWHDPKVELTNSAADHLSEILELHSVGLCVTNARVTGRGAQASIDLRLSNGTELTFESAKDFAHPGRMAVELAMNAGVVATFKVPHLIQALALVREIAKHEDVVTTDDLSRELGTTYLQSATRQDVDMSDQAARWEAFCMLERVDPIAATRRDPVTIAQASVVLQDPEGNRYVRCNWFASHFRREDPTASPKEVAHRMQRVGWKRRGKEGRIRATPKGRDGQLNWAFYVVPAGWENAQ